MDFIHLHIIKVLIFQNNISKLLNILRKNTVLYYTLLYSTHLEIKNAKLHMGRFRKTEKFD